MEITHGQDEDKPKKTPTPFRVPSSIDGCIGEAASGCHHRLPPGKRMGISQEKVTSRAEIQQRKVVVSGRVPLTWFVVRRELVPDPR